MCGIAGRFNFLSRAPVQPAVLRGMCDLLAHRGPDGEGIHVDGPLGLGHRRLAIIDLSAAGHQPMRSEDGRLWITYNGEVYNFAALRTELAARGHRFRSRTDAEVILAAYRQFGSDCLGRFRGMFALAIWDAEEHTLFLARDRVGKKPLFYLQDDHGIAFASEPKALVADPTVAARPDLEAIWHYLTYQYVPAPASGLLGVRQLPPAHYLVVRDGRVSTHRYWTLRYDDKRDLTEPEAREELLGLLKEAVALRLASDVPLGAFLSGGIDSSTIVALSALGGAPLKTFAVGFEDKDYDELPYARLVARRYGTDHHELVCRLDATEILPRLVWHYDRPYADSSAVPTYYLARFARQHVTVALNGDGGDENMAGYPRYLANAIAIRLDRVPRLMRRGLAAAVAALPARGRSRTWRTRARQLLGAVASSPERRYGAWVSHFQPPLKRELCTEEFARAAGGRDSLDLVVGAYAASTAPDFVDATLDVDVATYLPDDLLVKVDIATMAHGLEARSPFLDHEVMEFCAALPSRLKLRGTTSKYLLKQAVQGLLPREIIRRAKTGFGVPLDRWLRSELRDMAYDLLLSPRALERGYFRKDVIRRLLDEHVQCRRNWQYQLWNLLMLELWHRTFIDARPVAGGDGVVD